MFAEALKWLQGFPQWRREERVRTKRQKGNEKPEMESQREGRGAPDSRKIERTNRESMEEGEEQLPGTSHLGTTDPHPSITFTFSSHLSNTCVSVLLRRTVLIFNLIVLLQIDL